MRGMTHYVLVHGGGFDSRCWDLLLPHLDRPALAVDLPGRGAHPAPWERIDFRLCAESVAADVDAAGADEVVLVGHSLAGCVLPAIVGVLGRLVRHAVFVGCTVPEQGRSAFDTLDPAIQQRIRDAGPIEPRPMDPAMAKIVLGNDLDEEQIAWCVDRLVPEAPSLTQEEVDLTPFTDGPPRTWVRTLQDVIVPAEKQSRFADNLGDCAVVDIDAGHMCMVSQPAALAGLLASVDR